MKLVDDDAFVEVRSGLDCRQPTPLQRSRIHFRPAPPETTRVRTSKTQESWPIDEQRSDGPTDAATSSCLVL